MSKKSRTEKQDGLLELERPRPTSLPPLPDHPLVSVIMASRNQRAYIEDAIRSVLDQDYDAIELLVIDGASTDGTLEILHKYENDPRVWWISEPDAGPMDACNKGFAMARGDLVGILPSSDCLEPEAISKLVREYTRGPLFALVGGWMREIDETGTPTGHVTMLRSGQYDYTVDDIVQLSMFPRAQSSLFRRDLVISIGGFDERFRVLHGPFLLHYFLQGATMGAGVRAIPKVLSRYRLHEHGWYRTDEHRGIRASAELRQACKELAQRYKDFLTRQQTRTLRRTAYYLELKQRILHAHQSWQALPAALGYFWFGGGPHMLRHLVNRLRGRI